MAMQQFLNEPDDIQWCREVHLQGVHGLRFASFVIIGNEDSPDELHLYADADPDYRDQFIRVTFPDGAPVVTIEAFDTDAFIRAYVECALWSTCGPYACENLDGLFGPDDISPECMESMRADCLDFIGSNASDILEYCARMHNEQWSGENRAGHDFWLTRNGHGAGFWDRGLGDLGDRLANAARVYGDCFIYPGDDGRIYC